MLADTLITGPASVLDQRITPLALGTQKILKGQACKTRRRAAASTKRKTQKDKDSIQDWLAIRLNRANAAPTEPVTDEHAGSRKRHRWTIDKVELLHTAMDLQTWGEVGSYFLDIKLSVIKSKAYKLGYRFNAPRGGGVRLANPGALVVTLRPAAPSADKQPRTRKKS